MYTKTNNIMVRAPLILASIAVGYVCGSAWSQESALASQPASRALKVRLTDESGRVSVSGLTVVVRGRRRVDRIDTDKNGEITIPVLEDRPCRLRVDIKVGERVLPLDRIIVPADIEKGMVLWDVGEYVRHGQCIVTVVDRATKAPICGISVIVRRDRADIQSRTTDEDGRVAIWWRGKGAYVMTGILPNSNTATRTLDEADWRAKHMEWALAMPKASIEVSLWEQSAKGRVPLRDRVRLSCWKYDERGKQVSHEPAESRGGKVVFWDGVKGASYGVKVAPQQYVGVGMYYCAKPVVFVWDGGLVKMEATVLPVSRWDRKIAISVVDSHGVRLAGANIVVFDANNSKVGESRAGQDGAATIGSVSPGKCTIVVRKDGCASVRRQVNVPSERCVRLVMQRVYELLVNVPLSGALSHPRVTMVSAHGRWRDAGSPDNNGQLRVKEVPQGKYLVLAIGKQHAKAGGAVLVGSAIVSVPSPGKVSIHLAKANMIRVEFTGGSVPRGRNCVFVDTRSGYVGIGQSQVDAVESYLVDGSYDIYVENEPNKYMYVGKTVIKDPGKKTVAIREKNGERMLFEAVLDRTSGRTANGNTKGKESR